MIGGKLKIQGKNWEKLPKDAYFQQEFSYFLLFLFKNE
jgi:hypothetical protein